MKKGIHPENYRTVLFYDSNAKQGFLIRSCARTTNTMKWEDGNEYPVKQDKLPAKVVRANLRLVTENSVR